MDEAHAILLNEIRYSERLCQRTARMYRRVQAAGAFFAVLGGSAGMVAGAQLLPPWAGQVGAALFAAFGALLLVMRPGDKAAMNEADVRRYSRLRTEAATMDADQLRAALYKARESDAAEVEPLRDVAWNDVMHEIGAPEKAVRLRLTVRLLAALA